jgi:predicted nucleic acid-binding Zn ribbon protein
MKCTNCSRELNEDSRYCDQCGATVEQEPTAVKRTFDKKLLLFGIVISILVTLIITNTAGIIGFPLFFGGLFLPFFWDIKKKDGK